MDKEKINSEFTKIHGMLVEQPQLDDLHQKIFTFIQKEQKFLIVLEEEFRAHHGTLGAFVNRDLTGVTNRELIDDYVAHEHFNRVPRKEEEIGKAADAWNKTLNERNPINNALRVYFLHVYIWCKELERIRIKLNNPPKEIKNRK